MGYWSKNDILLHAVNNRLSDTLEALLKNNYPLPGYAFKIALKNNYINIISVLIKYGVLDVIYDKKKEKTDFIPFLVNYLSDSYDRKGSYKLVFKELNYSYMNEFLIYLIENPNRSDVRSSIIDLFNDYSKIIDCICQEWDGVYDSDRQMEVYKKCENTINELIKIKTKTSTYILNLFVKHKKDIRLCTVSLDGFAMNHTTLSLKPLRNKAEIEIISRGNTPIDHSVINCKGAWKIHEGDTKV